MNINRSNYEIYFLDYLDGNLPDDQIDDFLDFLQANPDLHQELKDVSSVKRMNPSVKVFPNKSKLLKNELTWSSNFDYKAVALLENDLSEDDERIFIRELTADEEKEEYFDLFLQTKLQPDKSIVFENKQALYRKSNAKLILFWAARVAAALVLLFAVWSIWKFPSGQPASVPIAERKAPAPVIERVAQKEEMTNVNTSPVSQPNEMDEQVAAKGDKSTVQPLDKLQPSIPTQSNSARLVVVRDEAPTRLKSLQPRLDDGGQKQAVALVGMEEYQLDEKEYITVDEYLAEKLLKKDRNEPLTFKHILSAGLDAVASASNDRVDYETTQEGRISEVSLNTRLFAFSIPFKKNK